MTTKTLLTAGILSTLIAAPALAGGLNEPVAAPAPAPAPTPVVIPTADWTGFYAGGSLGTATVDTGDAEIDGTTFGLHGGYNYDLGNVVVGGELEFSRLMLDTDGDPEADVLRLKGRVGYDAGTFLPYVTAGLAQLDSDDLGLSGEDGAFYGLGADFAVTDSVLVGAEFLQHEFDDAGIEAQTLGLRASFKF